VSICRDVFGQGDEFVQKITGNPNVDRPLQLIRKFRNRLTPKVVVTVDMLSTGVDIPALEFIVFLRPVKSRILWEQMLGRGTRLCPEINKSHFTIFDCFDGTLIEYFDKVSSFKIEPPRKEPTPLPQIIENIYQNIERCYNIGLLMKRLRRIEKEMTGKAREELARFIPGGDIGQFATQLPALIENDFTRTLKLLRDKEFQTLLLNYERAKRSFWVAYETQDEVSSERRDRFGQFDKPEDYLQAFSKFVKENADRIIALKVLLERPKQWKTEALEEPLPCRSKAKTLNCFPPAYTVSDLYSQNGFADAGICKQKAKFALKPKFPQKWLWNWSLFGLFNPLVCRTHDEQPFFFFRLI
jgi:type I restriction enzyme R subunit